MKELLRDYIAPIAGVIGILIDILLRIFPIDFFDFLIKPVFAMNILEIGIVLIIISLIYHFLPGVYNKFYNRTRARNLLKNWKEFKLVLQRYYVDNKKTKYLAGEYIRIRDLIERDFNYFLKDIVEIQRHTHRNYQDLVLRNFEQCWVPRRIEEWQKAVQRQIPQELDGFDYILIALVEHFNK